MDTSDSGSSSSSILILNDDNQQEGDVEFLELPPIIVPFGWSRRLTERKPSTVFYVTPSAHVLFSMDDVTQYFEDETTCKCYINTNLRLDEIFNFGRSRNVIQQMTLQPGVRSYCQDWLLDNYPNETADDARMDMWKANVAIDDEAIEDWTEIFKVLTGNCLEMETEAILLNEQFHIWLKTFPWELVTVTKDGEMLLLNRTENNSKHLLYEKKLKEELYQQKI